MLNNLHLTEFMKHKELDIEFSPKETLIVGPNWVGKTTIFKAVMFALFGPSAVPGGAKVIQRRGSDKKPSVSLSFTIAPHTYTVVRKWTVSRLHRDGAPIATGPANVTAAVEELLGMPAKLFGELRTSPQDEVSAILTLGVGRLNQIVGQITQADLIEKILELLKSRKQQADLELSVLPEYDLPRLAEERDSLFTSLTAQHAELIQRGQEKESTAGALESVMQAMTALNAQLTEYHAVSEQAIVLRTTEASLVPRLAEAESASNATIQDPTPLYQRLEQLRTELSAAVQQMKERVKTLAALEELQTVRDLKSIEFEDKQTVWAALNHQVQKDYEEQLQKVWKLSLDYGAAQENLRVSEEAAENSICPTCLREFDNVDPEAVVTARDTAQVKLAACAEELTAAESLLGTLQQQVDEEHRLGAEIDTLRDALDDFTTKERLLRTSLPAEVSEETLQQKRQELEDTDLQYRDCYAAFAQQKTALQSVEQLRKELVATQSELATLPEVACPTQEDLTAASEAVADATAASIAASDTATRLTEQYATSYRSYEQTVASLEAATQAETGRKAKQVLADNMEKLSTYLKRAHADFIKRTWSNILHYVSEFVSLCTNRKVTKISITAGSKFEYVEDGETMLLAQASGFQRACMGVGVRMALAEAIRAPAGVLLLDEVTAGATPENSLAMAQALSQVGQQVVLVSHRQADAAVAQQVVALRQ